VPRVAGKWKDLTDTGNCQLAANLTEQVRVIVKVGDLPPRENGET